MQPTIHRDYLRRSLRIGWLEGRGIEPRGVVFEAVGTKSVRWNE